jgi:uncharacterized protein YndB with AHSA1/START domain
MTATEKMHVEIADQEVIFTRIINAPRELVFKAWTDSKHVAKWWGPHGFTNPVCEMDVRSRGTYRIVMRSPDGVEYPVKGVYLEVVENERLVMTDDCSGHPDEWHDLVNPNRDKGKGKPALESINTVIFENHNGKTKLSIRTRFESAAVRDAMLKMGMSEGWGESLERLEALLADA